MAITTKRNLDKSKFKQESTDELILSGKTVIDNSGEIIIDDGVTSSGRVVISDENNKLTWTETGQPNGIASLDENSKLEQNIDASKINSGTISIERLPAGALERLIPVADETERFQLTTNQVQNGDTVQQLDTGVMYRVVDETNLNNENGYREYTAGRASAVDWTGIENKPNDLTELSGHTITELGDINPNVVIGNDLNTPNSPKEISINENHFLGRLSGENIKGVEAINMYGLSEPTKLLIENDNNWNEDGLYIGTAISDAKAGQKHYDSYFIYEFVTDITPIRLSRKVLASQTEIIDTNTATQYDNTKVDGYEAGDIVTFRNINSSNPQFQEWYLYVAQYDIATGISPEDDTVGWLFSGNEIILVGNYVEHVQSEVIQNAHNFNAGDEWLNNQTLILYNLYDDGNNKYWVEMGNGNFNTEFKPYYKLIEEPISWSDSLYVINLSNNAQYTLTITNGTNSLNFGLSYPLDANEISREVIIRVDNSNNNTPISTISFQGNWKWSIGNPVTGLASNSIMEMYVRNINNNTVKALTDVEE